ncbi:heterokaryon incompatibility protein-domain-containing protein [Xylaria arbuscula]|nr:heterokaryon incompatibility protein-domain-containing protein [Xylaria arbuscula]
MAASQILAVLSLPLRLAFMLLAALLWIFCEYPLYVATIVFPQLMVLPMSVAITIRFQEQTSQPGTVTSEAAKYLMSFKAVSEIWTFVLFPVAKLVSWLPFPLFFIMWYSMIFAFVCLLPAYYLLRWPLKPLWRGFEDWAAMREILAQWITSTFLSVSGAVGDARYEYWQGEWREKYVATPSLRLKIYSTADFLLEQQWIGRLSKSVFAHAYKIGREAFQTVQSLVGATLRSPYVPSLVKVPLAGTALVTAFVEDALEKKIAHLFRCMVVSTSDWSSELQAVEQNAKRSGNDAIYTSRLSSEDIRLLCILPGVEGQPLRCLLYSKPRSSTRYQALSYVWGDPKLERFIMVNSKRCVIGKNLYDCLVRLRRPDTKCELWVDALCINQADLQERSEQVLCMGELYRNADKVLIWLGPDVPGIGDIFCPGYCESHPDGGQDLANPDIVYHLLSSEWWSRVWTVQELILGSSVLVQCGKYNLPWDSFCEIIDSHTKGIKSSDLEKTFYQEYLALKSERKLFTERARRRYPLLEQIYKYRGKRATQARDKIYGFYGLLDDASLEVTPNYVIHQSIIQESFAVHFINRYKSLAVIALAELSMSDFNSKKHWWWFPEWKGDGTTSSRTLFWTGLGDEIGQQPWSEEAFDAACGNAVKRACEKVGHPYDYAIELEGWRVDRVVEVGAEIKLETLGEPNCDHILLKQWLKMTRNPNIDPEVRFRSARPQTLWRTITAGEFGEEQPPESRRYSQYLAARTAACRGRRLFVTAAGRYGLGPPDTSAGDQVWILFGMAVPAVLSEKPRPRRSGSLVYIGQAYVDDLMNARDNGQPDILVQNLDSELVVVAIYEGHQD